MSEKLYFDTSASENIDANVAESDPYVANPANVKDEYVYKNAYTRELQVGTMTINEPTTIRINPSPVAGSNTYYTIPEGYHYGTGKVEVGSLSEYTKGNATPEDVINNKTFWVNGEKLVGTLNVEQVTQVGTATSDDIVSGKTAWVNGEKITGTIPVLPRKDQTLIAGESYVFPYGLSAGTTTISAASLSSQTPGDATSKDIISGYSAWVNGEKIIGTFNINKEIKDIMADTDAEQNMVLYGKKFYSSIYGSVMSGRMIDHTGEPTRTIEVGQLYQIPQGYYDGSSYITTKSLRDITIGSAEDKNILIGKTAWVNGNRITGTMPMIDSLAIELDAGSTYSIPEGYHTGTGSVTTKSISDQTPGNARPDDIVSGKTAWANGTKVTGTMQDNSDISKELSPGETYYIPAGYHNGTGNIWSKPISDITPGSAKAENILEGETAWVDGIKITGTMVNNGSYTVIDAQAGNIISIPEGYHDGTGTISIAGLESQTEANSDPSDIISGKTAWVNGEKITGSLAFNGTALSNDVIKDRTFYNTDAKTIVTGTLELVGNATEEDVISGVVFYSNDPKRKKVGALTLSGTSKESNVLVGTTFYNTDPKNILTGTMPNNGSVSVELNAGESFVIPEGYHDGTGKVSSNDITGQTPGTAESDDIISGQTAWVNGEKITGTLTLEGTAIEDKVLSGFTFYNNNPKQKLEGSIPVFEPQQHQISGGQSYSIAPGYYKEGSIVIADSISDQTPGTAISDDIISGKTAWVNGEKITGTIPVNNAESISINAEETYTIPRGYHDGTGTITGNSLSGQTEGTATDLDILSTKTAWVNGTKVTGTMQDNSDWKMESVLAGQTVYIPRGYHDGNGTIITETLDNQTPGNVSSEDILSDKIAWSNGQKIIGTIPTGSIDIIRIAAGNDTIIPAGYYPNGITIFALYTDNIVDLTGTSAYYLNEGLYPNGTGYVDEETSTLIITADIIVDT